MPESSPPAAGVHASLRWALMFGNFVIGCGVMSVAGTLNDIARSLDVSVALAGQLIAIAAATMAFGAPLMAGWVAAFDRTTIARAGTTRSSCSVRNCGAPGSVPILP